MNKRFQLLLFTMCLFQLVFSAEKDTLVVSQDRTGDFVNIQEAINATASFPYTKKVILIKNGIYHEKVKIHQWNTNLVIIGENKDQTIITFDDYFDKINLGRNSTFHTYTLLVEAHDVVLKNLTIRNTAGDIGQAIALAVFSNRFCAIDCRIEGYQDTLYASGEGKHYFKNCYISGTTDFIFGHATALFENCIIHSKKDSYVTAASTEKNQAYGFVFLKCKLTADKNISKVYLGRPWRIYAKTVFIHCDLGQHILPEGWHNWNKKEAEKTTFFAEYQNNGLGFQPEKRVKWSKQLTKNEVKKFTLKHILFDKHHWYENN